MPADLEFIIEKTVSLASVPVVFIIMVLLGRKWWTTVNADGKRDTIRLLIFLQVSFWVVSTGITVMFETFVEDNYFNVADKINIISILVGCIACTGMTIAAYVYQRESWYYTPWFFYFGTVIYYYLTGFNGFQRIWLIFGNLVYLVFYYANGIKYKDDKVLGLAIFFTFPVVNGFVQDNLLFYTVIHLSLVVFGLLYAMGKVRIFQRGEKHVVLSEGDTRPGENIVYEEIKLREAGVE